MAEAAAFEAPKANPAVKWGFIALGVLLFALGWFLYRSMTGVHGVQAKEAPPVISQLLPLPPPPPPPPPPKPQEKPPEPTEKPTPQPSAEPKPNAPAPMQMNAEAQAGPGSLASGTGTGLGTPSGIGTCLGSNCGTGGIGDAFYGRYLSSELQQRVQDENRVNRSVFTADFAIWISTSGAVTKVELVKGSGDDRRDTLVASLLNKVTGLDPPPSSFRFPQRITVRGRRSL